MLHTRVYVVHIHWQFFACLLNCNINGLKCTYLFIAQNRPYFDAIKMLQFLYGN